MKLLLDGLLVIVGLSGGFAVGGGLVAFITVLDIIPRLTQLTNSRSYIRAYEWALISGALFFTVIDFFSLSFRLAELVTALVGLFAGVFVGTLAAGLTEVLNVFPILAKRLSMTDFILSFLMAMVAGKLLGSLVQWLFRL
ncbi:stage V sporulation protein AB [Brevibacillus massiliensis]|jgi:stage V sporulation protein AB|uniref:stage V sporulation protein AB n=1 Tax=Brevibacillus massiliensis TaxID=1118054 RepID=UPI0003826A35|nr:stage V sporulation protein AB [Brevibacillus massiliensis]